MKTLTSFAVGIVVPAFIMAGGWANSAAAQDKAAKGAPVIKVLLDNAKVKVYDSTYKPGDVNTGIASTSTRIVRVLKGGTTEFTFADGKKETHVRTVGEVYMVSPGPAYTNKNIGKTDVQLYVVQLK
jgi:hypothetical protein